MEAVLLTAEEPAVADPVEALAVEEEAAEVEPQADSVWQRGSTGSPPPPPALPPLPPPPIHTSEPVVRARSSSSLPPLQIAALAGFGAAIVATLFAWLRVSSGFRSEAVNGWNSEAQYRVADWLSLDAPIDALLVIVIAGLGIYLLLGRVLGSNVPALPYVVAACGLALAIIGVLNWIYIDSEGNRVVNPDLSVGFGVYLLIIGGAVAAFCGYRDGQAEKYTTPSYEEQAA